MWIMTVWAAVVLVGTGLFFREMSGGGNREERGADSAQQVGVPVRGIKLDQMDAESLFNSFQVALIERDGEMAVLTGKLLIELPNIPWEYKGRALVHRARLLHAAGQKVEARTIFWKVAANPECESVQNSAFQSLEQLYGETREVLSERDSAIDLFGK